MYYFDNAATTFQKPKEVLETYIKVMNEYGANPGRSGHSIARKAGMGIYETREIVASFFGIDNPMQIAFTANATESLNIGVKGILKSGDHVITTSMEHNSVLRPLNSALDVGVEHTVINANTMGQIDLLELENAIKSNTKMIVTTHASNLTGTIFPIYDIAKIAKKHKLIYMLDAAQTAGVIDIDVKKIGIDILAVTGHKSLFGPQGTGIIYIDEKLDIKPLKEGGTGSKSYELRQPTIMPDLLESGTPNTPGIIALGAGIKFIQREGIQSIFEHETELCKYFMENIIDLKGIKIYGETIGKLRAPVVPINIGAEDSSAISYILDDEYDIATRPGLHCAPLAHKSIKTFEQGCVRFSFGYFNTKAEIDRAIKALSEISARL